MSAETGAAAPRETTTVTIFGTEYRITGSASPAYIAEVAAYVDRSMRDLAARLSLASPSRLAILAALHIADELFRERSAREQALASVRERAEVLRLMLDESAADKTKGSGGGGE